MDDLVTWLRAQLDEDERVAQEAAQSAGEPEWRDGVLLSGNVKGIDVDEGTVVMGPWSGELFEVGEHIARHDPGRVLVEVAAKRRILDDCASYVDDEGDAVTDGLSVRVIALLALPFVDRPGYRPEWAPPNG